MSDMDYRALGARVRNLIERLRDNTTERPTTYEAADAIEAMRALIVERVEADETKCRCSGFAIQYEGCSCERARARFANEQALQDFTAGYRGDA